MLPSTGLAHHGCRSGSSAQDSARAHSRYRDSCVDMTFQAYLDTIREKTGLSPADFRILADKKGLLADGTKPAAVLAWLTEDFGLGRGHGMAIVSTFRERPADADRIEKQFAGARAHWRAAYEAMLTMLEADGPVSIAPTDTYLSLLKGSRKFAVVSFTADRMDVGITLEDTPVAGRLEAAGTWNRMVTHRVRISDRSEIDAELINWLRQAYFTA